MEKAKKKLSIDAEIPSESSDTLNLEELADFNKIMEKQFKSNMKKEFHQKFHNINKIQNKDIDEKLKLLSKQRNTDQLKYLLKKQVNNFKDNINEIKIKLEKLDDDLVDPDREKINALIANSYFANGSKEQRGQSAILGLTKSSDDPIIGSAEEENMKDAFMRMLLI